MIFNGLGSGKKSYGSYQIRNPGPLKVLFFYSILNGRLVLCLGLCCVSGPVASVSQPPPAPALNTTNFTLIYSPAGLECESGSGYFFVVPRSI